MFFKVVQLLLNVPIFKEIDQSQLSASQKKKEMTERIIFGGSKGKFGIRRETSVSLKDITS